ncbi:MAG: hypothetical protein ABW004_03960 [Aeromicrobium sp.]|jgi:hypothetical protein
MKRLVVGVFVSALTVFGVVPAASAAPADDSGIVKVAKAKKIKPVVIDWDSIGWSAPTDGGLSAQRIDWD